MKEWHVQTDGGQAVSELFSSLDARHEQHGPARRHVLQKTADHQIALIGTYVMETSERNVRAIHSSHDNTRIRYPERLQDPFLALNAGCGGKR